MYYVYILLSLKIKQLYIGYTTNVVKRLEEHNNGLSSYTRKYRPWCLVYLEGYASEEEAHDREQKLKQYGKVYSQLKRRIKRSILSAQKVRG